MSNLNIKDNISLSSWLTLIWKFNWSKIDSYIDKDWVEKQNYVLYINFDGWKLAVKTSINPENLVVWTKYVFPLWLKPFHYNDKEDKTKIIDSVNYFLRSSDSIIEMK